MSIDSSIAQKEKYDVALASHFSHTPRENNKFCCHSRCCTRTNNTRSIESFVLFFVYIRSLFDSNHVPHRPASWPIERGTHVSKDFEPTSLNTVERFGRQAKLQGHGPKIPHSSSNYSTRPPITRPWTLPRQQTLNTAQRNNDRYTIHFLLRPTQRTRTGHRTPTTTTKYTSQSSKVRTTPPRCRNNN